MSGILLREQFTELGNVTPCFMLDDSINCGISYPVTSSEQFPPHLAGSVQSANVSYLSIGELGRAVNLSTTWHVMAFTHHIQHILKSGPEKEVGRIDTRRIITRVQNPQSMWDRAIMKLPGKPMRQNILAIVAKVAVAPICWPCEGPTTVWSRGINHCPKLFEGVITMTVTTKESKWLAFDPAIYSARFVSKVRGLATTALTKTWGDGRMFLHRKLLSSGAVLRAVDAAPGPLIAQHYHINVRGVK